MPPKVVVGAALGPCLGGAGDAEEDMGDVGGFFFLFCGVKSSVDCVALKEVIFEWFGMGISGEGDDEGGEEKSGSGESCAEEEDKGFPWPRRVLLQCLFCRRRHEDESKRKSLMCLDSLA